MRLTYLKPAPICARSRCCWAMPSSSTRPCTCTSRRSICPPWPTRWIRFLSPTPTIANAPGSCKSHESATLRGGRHHPTIRQSLRRKEPVLVDVAPSPRTACHRVLPHGNTRWPPGPLPSVRPRGHLFQLLPVQALSKVPNQRSRQVAHRAQQGTAAGPLRPCRLHPAPRAFVADFTQQESHLRPVVSHCQGKVEMSPSQQNRNVPFSLGLGGVHVNLRVPVKRRRAMLASNPIKE